MNSDSRRSFFRKVVLGSLGAGIFSDTFSRQTPSPTQKGFSFLHLTDMHVRRKRLGNKGYEACIDHVNRYATHADFVLMGGDLAFDGNYTEKEEFIDQIDLY